MWYGSGLRTGKSFCCCCFVCLPCSCVWYGSELRTGKSFCCCCFVCLPCSCMWYGSGLRTGKSFCCCCFVCLPCSCVWYGSELRTGKSFCCCCFVCLPCSCMWYGSGLRTGCWYTVLFVCLVRACGTDQVRACGTDQGSEQAVDLQRSFFLGVGLKVNCCPVLSTSLWAGSHHLKSTTTELMPQNGLCSLNVLWYRKTCHYATCLGLCESESYGVCSPTDASSDLTVTMVLLALSVSVSLLCQCVCVCVCVCVWHRQRVASVYWRECVRACVHACVCVLC